MSIFVLIKANLLLILLLKPIRHLKKT